MHRANAAKALRSEAVEKWQRIAAAAAVRDQTPDEEGQQALLPSNDLSSSNVPGAFMRPFLQCV